MTQGEGESNVESHPFTGELAGCRHKLPALDPFGLALVEGPSGKDEQPNLFDILILATL